MYEYLPTPAVAVELDTVEKNIKSMVEQNKSFGVAVRPHIKPHKSVYFAKLQLALGCKGITCAKLGEAEVMADAGIRDILIAFPLIGADKMDRLAALTDRAEVTVIVNSMEGAEQLSCTAAAKNRRLRTLIEVDGGLRRGGKEPGAPTLEFARSIRDLPGLSIAGLMYYSGVIYGESTREGFERMARKERNDIVETASLLERDGFSMEVLSGGSSYSAKMPWLMEGLSEVRPGPFYFQRLRSAGDRLCHG